MTNWLTQLAGQSLGNFEATPELDRDLSRRALAARSDASERDALYALLAAKIERFAARFRYWRLEPFSIEDVLQESYPLFVETVASWTPRYEGGEPVGYLYYFLRVYPHWLSNAVSRMTNRRHPAMLALPNDDDRDQPDPTPPGDVATSTVVDDLCEHLSTEQATMLRLRVVSDQSLSYVARELGIARRTAYRRWHNIIEIGRRYWEEVG